MQLHLNYSTNPQVFQVNHTPDAYNHPFFISAEHSTANYKDGVFQQNNEQCKSVFFDLPTLTTNLCDNKSYDASNSDSIFAPSHIQLNDYEQINYTNTIFFRDKHEDLNPP